MEQNFREIIKEILLEIDKLIEKRETKHVVGNSPFLMRLLHLDTDLESYERNALKYFLPYAKWIRKDFLVLAYCFQTVLELEDGEILITEVPPSQIMFKGESIDQWKIDVSSFVGGPSCNPLIHLLVLIKLNKEESLNQYLLGGKKRDFLENILYPKFLGESYQITTQIFPCYPELKFRPGPKVYSQNQSFTSMI